MKRRALLATVAVGATAASGCLAVSSSEDDGSNESLPAVDDPPYERCQREVVHYDNLPAKPRAEVDAALNGSYESEHVYLRDAIEIDTTFVSLDDRFYRPSVTETASGSVLHLEHLTPKLLPDRRLVRLAQYRDRELTVTLRIVADDGDVLIDERYSLDAEEDVVAGTLRRAGEHDVHVTIEHEGTVVDELHGSAPINEFRLSLFVRVDEDLSVGGTVAEVAPCDYDVDRSV